MKLVNGCNLISHIMQPIVSNYDNILQYYCIYRHFNQINPFLTQILNRTVVSVETGIWGSTNRSACPFFSIKKNHDFPIDINCYW